VKDEALGRTAMTTTARLPVPEITVVVPTHNRSDLLGLTLRSVVWQQDVELEVIVVDDGSIDDTSEVVAAFGDPRIRLIRLDVPQGVSAARNRGIAEARAEWIAFLDDDDLWAPDKLASQLRAVKNDTGNTWVYAGAVNVDGLTRVRGGAPPLPPDRFAELLPRSNPMPGGCSNALMRTETLQRIGGFDTGLRILADWDLWLRLVRHGSPSCVRRPLIAYRIHSANMSLDAKGMLAELGAIERRHGSSVDRSGFARYVAGLRLRAGRRGGALWLFLRAAAAGPVTGFITRLPGDIRLVIGELLRAARGRIGLPLSRRTVLIQERTALADPNRSWKAEAENWLAALMASGRPPDRRVG
jgi:glycosyltransferase involved in cell wall biosynthesis